VNPVPTANGSRTPAIALRPALPADEEFLLEVYASTRAEEMALTPWTESQRESFVKMQFAAQSSHYKEKYPEANHDVIMTNGRRVGRLYVARLKDEIRIVDITILPDDRNAGIGGALLTKLIDEAKSSEKPLKIYVEVFNPSLRLFKRLGFVQVDAAGVHCLMLWPNTT
jgi:ribosomal protein S18 acetylase RimI-like enzyme